MPLPNIILVTADGLRWDGMGCAGDPHIRTPNIDALAAHGLRFTNVVSAFPQHPSGGHAFLTGAAAGPFMPGGAAASEASDTLILPAALREAGYTTSAIGALDFSPRHDTTAFDECLATGCVHLEDAYSAWLKGMGKPLPAPASPPGAEPETRLFSLGEPYHPTTWTGNCAVRYCQNAPEPFFLWVSFPRPRPPFDPPAPWNRMYLPGQLPDRRGRAGDERADERDVKRLLAAYYGCISQLDRQLARILATLTARGRTQNLFLLTAGSGMPASRLLGASGPAENLPETLIRVPLLIAGHPQQRKGTAEPALVGLGDIVPTLFEMLRLDGSPRTECRSFYRQLLEAGLPHRQAVVSAGRAGAASLRTARYKWVDRPGVGEEGLFDLQADPLEMHNLSGTRQSLALRKMLLGVSQREARAAE